MNFQNLIHKVIFQMATSRPEISKSELTSLQWEESQLGHDRLIKAIIDPPVIGHELFRD